jgi:hypothetical protein
MIILNLIKLKVFSKVIKNIESKFHKINMKKYIFSFSFSIQTKKKHRFWLFINSFVI